MRISSDDLRRHYASLSDAELLDLDRSELAGMAQGIYDEEVSRRKLDGPREAAPDDGEPVEDFEETAEGPDFEPEPEIGGDDPPPDWLEDAACPWAVLMHARMLGQFDDYASQAARVRAVLREAGIPSHIVVRPPDPPPPPAPRPSEYCVMVPGDLNMEATSVIEREIFNPQQEEEWRNHLQALSDEQLQALKPEVFCGALLDRAERLKRAYFEEIASRKPHAPAR
jgi:hypothetical protein